jgi:transcriptional regulator with GAF, ATPase, and Fis domain
VVVDHTQDLAELARLLTETADTRAILRHALEALREVVPYDLAAVLRLHEERLVVEVATGPLVGPKVLAHELALPRFPTIQRALATRRPIAAEAHHHESEEGDPYDGVLDLPHGHSCMVIPLSARERSLGIITLDRTVCERYDDASVRIAGLYGQLVSIALLLAEEKEALRRRQGQLEEQNRLLMEGQGASEAARRLEASHHPGLQATVRLARQAAPSRLPILILGETGTGKEVLSQAIHAWSDRAAGPFVKLNCSAIPEGLIESELFGHKRGAFSGAERDRPGRFLTANGGTLLLDEIGDLPLAAQAKLLRVLQEGTFDPVGADDPVKVDVRVLAATHVDLEAAVRAGRFRQDLWYRLAVLPLHLPPLRERPQDILRIAQGFLAEAGRRARGGPWTLGPAAEAALTAAPWPGNVRELLNVLERATVLLPAGELTPEHLMLQPALPSEAAPAPGPQSAFPTFEENERAYFSAALARSGGKLYGEDGAAALVGLKPSTLRSKLLKLGLR